MSGCVLDKGVHSFKRHPLSAPSENKRASPSRICKVLYCNYLQCLCKYFIHLINLACILLPFISTNAAKRGWVTINMMYEREAVK